MAIRVRVRIRAVFTGSSVEAVALANSGYETEVPVLRRSAEQERLNSP